MSLTRRNTLVFFTALLLVACGGEQAAENITATTASVDASAIPAASDTIGRLPAVPDIANCEPGQDIAYVCGVINGEDILRLGTSDWLLVSGMDGSLTGADIAGRLHLVNAGSRSVEILFPTANSVYQHDTENYASCPGPLDGNAFSAHGLSLQKSDKGPEIYRVYMTSHGAREAIEVFEVDAFIKPTIKWVGCIPMPTTSWTNSVAMLEDGGFVATQFFNPDQHTIENVMAGEVTGHVYEWHPGGEVTVIAGTQLAGPNGIAVSDDGRWIFVAEFGTGNVIRFDRSSTPPAKDVIPVGILPDNLRWTPGGTLLAAGDNTENFCGRPPCEPGWGVVEIVPYNLVATRIVAAREEASLQNPSVALRVNNQLWVGTYSGDRLAILPLTQ